MLKPDIRESIDRIRQLPTLPSVLGRILSTTSDPATSALELGQLIASDQSLSAAILRLVNSAYYGFPRQIETVTQAVVILGFFKVRNLTLTASAFHQFRGSSSQFDRVQLWRHALASGMAAERLAYLANVDNQGCYEAGLLHDIGKVALDTLFPEAFARAAQEAQTNHRLMHEVVEESLGISPVEAGAVLAERWSLPLNIVEAIRCHLTPEDAKEYPKLSAITALAAYVTYPAGLGETSNGRDLPFPGAALDILGVEEQDVRAIADVLSENRDKIDDLLGALGAE